MKKDTNCPLCFSGMPMGLSPEGWRYIQETHEREHLDKCDKCGQPVAVTHKEN